MHSYSISSSTSPVGCKSVGKPLFGQRLWLRVLLLAVAGATGTANAKTEHYQLDPVHTRVAFQVSHAGFSNPVGTFSGATGSLEFDENDWSSAKLSVQIPLATLDLGDADWQEKILDQTFFDAKKFPEARFVSTRVETTGTNSAIVTGELSLHGVRRPVSLTVTLNQLKRHPLTFKKTAGFSATAVLSRKDFGIDAWKSVVGDEVRLIMEAEALRSASDNDNDNDNDNDDTTPDEDAAEQSTGQSSEPNDADPR
jgi:polyisoprenoid-binding protein YceI